MARPTWSLSKYMQQVGRGLRTSLGKDKTIILDNAGMYARFGLPSETRLWNATFAGVDFRDHYIGSVGSKNCYLRLKYENSSQLMLLVYNDGKDVYSMEDEVIEEEVDIAPETNDLPMQNLNISEIQPAVCEESVISDTDGKVESTKDHVSDEEDISLPKTKIHLQ